MAVTRTKLFDTIANGAAWDAGVVFNRTNGIPIDKFSVFESLELATEYALTNPVAYPGQLVAVVPESGEATGYIILADGSLKELGAPVDSTLSIAGQAADAKSTGDAIRELASKFFVGTKAAFDEADTRNEIAIGAIVIITDDEIANFAAETAVLGQAQLGKMILGKA